MTEKVSGGSRGKPIRCRAAVCRKPGEPLVIEEIIVAPPMPHEVRIRIIYTSLCHSDITFWKMKVKLECVVEEKSRIGVHVVMPEDDYGVMIHQVDNSDQGSEDDNGISLSS